MFEATPAISRSRFIWVSALVVLTVYVTGYFAALDQAVQVHDFQSLA